MAELHSKFHPLKRIRCAIPACNRSMNRALLLFSLTPELGIGRIQFSFLYKILKHHNNQSLEPQFHSLPFSCTGKKQTNKQKNQNHKAHLYLFYTHKMLSSAVKKTIKKYSAFRGKKSPRFSLL